MSGVSVVALIVNQFLIVSHLNESKYMKATQ